MNEIKMPKRSRSGTPMTKATRMAVARSGRRKKSSYGKRGRVPRSINIRGAYSFSRYCTVTQASINGTFYAANIVTSLSQIIQASDFSALFDQYRITKVVLRVCIVNNPNANNFVNSTAVNQSNWYPKLWYIPDYDGGATETGASIRERQGVKCRILKPNAFINISFTPKCRVLTYSTASSTGYAPKNIKIDMTDQNVEHYGLNYVVDMQLVDVTDTQPYVLSIEKKIYFTCYGVR